MPGRGQPWKGVGKGNPDRIGTSAIADGSITEADLDSSLQAKINSEGSLTVIGNHIASTGEGSFEFDIADIDFSADSHIIAVIDATISNSTSLLMIVNQDETANYFRDGSRIIGGVETLLNSDSDTSYTLASNGIITGSIPVFVIIELGLTQGAVGGVNDAPRFFSRASSSGYEHSMGRLNVEYPSITHIRFKIATGGFTWRVGSRFTLYKVSRT